MSDKLHDYIRENRSAFDHLQAPDIWAGVAAGIHKTGFTFKPKNYKTMLKYGFGASAIVVASLVALHYSHLRPSLPARNATQVRSEKPDRTIFDTTPALVSAFVPVAPSLAQPTKTPEPEKKKQEPPAPPLPPTPPVDPVAPVDPPAPPAPPRQAGNTTPVAEPASMPEDTTDGPEYSSLDSIFRGINRVEVNGQVCHITITTHKKDHVHLKGEIREGGGDLLVLGMSAYRRKEYRIRVHRAGDLLRVWITDHQLKEKVKCSPNSKIESYLLLEVPEETGSMVYNCSGNITLTGPLKNKAQLKTSFGNISAGDIAGDLHVSSTSGNITLTNIKGRTRSVSSFGNQKFDHVKGDIEIRSSSGGITINDLQGDADINTSFGDQTLTEVRGNIKLGSSSGDIHITKHTGNATVKSTFGTQVYESVEGNITSRASSGDIRITDHKGQLSLGTSFGNIRGKNITLLSSSDFKASSGNISMDLLNKIEDLSFDLVSSSGNLTIEKSEIKKKADRQLQHGSGPIRIKGVSSFGNQSYH